MREVLMLRGAHRILQQNAGVRPGELVLIVTDFEKASLATILASAAMSLGAEPLVVTMLPRTVDGQEPPPAVAASLMHADVVCSLVAKSITHTHAIKAALAGGARVVGLTAFVEDQLIGGGIDADFEALTPLCRRVGALLAEATAARVTTPAGTALTMSLEGRPGNVHRGIVRNPGEFTTVPNAESSTSPVEGTADGTIVADASLPYYDIGLLQEPIVMQVKRGMITELTGGSQARVIAAMMAAQKDPNVYNIAQLSFGLNPKCRIRGVMLDDEGAYGTCHIGIGTSIMLGGEVKTPMHYDVLMWKPTLELDGKVVLRDGDWLLPEADAARAMLITGC